MAGRPKSQSRCLHKKPLATLDEAEHHLIFNWGLTAIEEWLIPYKCPARSIKATNPHWHLGRVSTNVIRDRALQEGKSMEQMTEELEAYREALKDRYFAEVGGTLSYVAA